MKKSSITLDDYIKAMKKGNREAEMELLGPGFHSNTKKFIRVRKFIQEKKNTMEDWWITNKDTYQTTINDINEMYDKIHKQVSISIKYFVDSKDHKFDSDCPIIRGSDEDPKKVIEILEIFGGINSLSHDGSGSDWAFGISEGIIIIKNLSRLSFEEEKRLLTIRDF